MKSKVMKRVVTLIATVALVGLIVPVNVNAADAKNVEITKKIEKPSDVYAPKTEFQFQISNGTAVPAAGTNPAIKAGVTGGVTFEDDTIASAPAAGDIGETTLTLPDKAKLKINIDQFTQPGIYRYLISEKAGSYKGMKYDGSEKYFDVYIRRNADTHLEAYSYAFVKTTDRTSKDDGIFTNKYGKKDKPDHSDWLSNFTVKKIVTGALGDKEKEFNFTVKVDGQTGEHFHVIRSDNQTFELVSGTQQTITLKNEQTIKITGLSEGDTYTVNEDDYTAEGYKVTYSGNHDGVAAVETDATLNVTNNNDVTTPTGILMAYGPYALLIIVAVALLVVFNRKKRIQDEE